MSRLRFGIDLKKKSEPNYKGIASLNIFEKALEDQSSEEETNPSRKGKLNYVAMIDKEKTGKTPVSSDFFQIEGEGTKEEDYDAHFGKIQEIRQINYQGRQQEVVLVAHPRKV